MSERVIAAAIRYEGIVYSCPQPKRHHDVIHMMHSEHGLGPACMHDQGFVTASGAFVNRKQALAIAQREGQIIEKTSPHDQLFSEDLW